LACLASFRSCALKPNAASAATASVRMLRFNGAADLQLYHRSMRAVHTLSGPPTATPPRIRIVGGKVIKEASMQKWVAVSLMCGCAAIAAQAKSLLNGRDLSGWARLPRHEDAPADQKPGLTV